VLKSGGGYVYLACPESLASSVAQGGKEIVFLPMQETGGRSIALNNKAELLEAAAKMRIVVIGPGLSLHEETQQLVKELVTEIDKPVIIDGDGITAVSQDIALLKKRKTITILTPHIGEMSRITGLERSIIEKNMVNVVQDTAHDLNSIIVLKGPHSLIGYPDGRVIFNVSGSTENRAGMATAGSGDVLNGTIAGMYCLGLSGEEAAHTGVFIHGLSGDMTAEEKGADGMTAKDILDNLPYAVQYYRENIDTIAADYYDSIYVI
jgi:NAD(P)H-hydrate epimerase